MLYEEMYLEDFLEFLKAHRDEKVIKAYEDAMKCHLEGTPELFKCEVSPDCDELPEKYIQELLYSITVHILPTTVLDVGEDTTETDELGEDLYIPVRQIYNRSDIISADQEFYAFWDGNGEIAMDEELADAVSNKTGFCVCSVYYELE